MDLSMISSQSNPIENLPWIGHCMGFKSIVQTPPKKVTPPGVFSGTEEISGFRTLDEIPLLV